MSDTAPTTPYDGQEWCYTESMITFTWYEDGDSGQWVQA